MAATVGRLIPDSTLSNSTALPSGAGTATSAAIDLVGAALDANSSFPEEVSLEVAVPATPNLVSAATITFTVMNDSAATPTTALSPTHSFIITGTAGNGAATTHRFKLPANVARYLSVRAVGGSSGAGDNTAVSFTTRLLF